ncbi:hypothetical protein [Neobacillus cucumis]|uniref:hypothetical protein n=1 Tax=Neobacillus cucumis TaxID=1740721 RepID=UPI001963EE7E|nr:hypothetical protein [Neobacillus cucumis]
MSEPKKVTVVWVTDYSDHFVEGKVFDDKAEAQTYNDEMIASKSPFIAGAEMEELEYVPKRKAEDLIEQIEGMDNGERIRALKLLHETYFYSRPTHDFTVFKMESIEEGTKEHEIAVLEIRKRQAISKTVKNWYKLACEATNGTDYSIDLMFIPRFVNILDEALGKLPLDKLKGVLNGLESIEYKELEKYLFEIQKEEELEDEELAKRFYSRLDTPKEDGIQITAENSLMEVIDQREQLPDSEWIEHDPQRYTLEEVKERFYPNIYKPIKLTGKDAQDVIDDLNGKVNPEEEKKRVNFLDDCKKLYEKHERKRLIGQIVPEDYLDNDEEIRKMADEAADEADFSLPQAREKYIEHFIKGYKESQEKTYKRLKELENSDE